MESNTGIIIKVRLWDNRSQYGAHKKSWEWHEGEPYIEEDEMDVCFENIRNDTLHIAEQLFSLADFASEEDGFWNLSNMWKNSELLKVKVNPSPSYVEYEVRIEDKFGCYLNNESGSYVLNISNIYIDVEQAQVRRFWKIARKDERFVAVAKAWEGCVLTVTPESITDYKMV